MLGKNRNQDIYSDLYIRNNAIANRSERDEITTLLTTYIHKNKESHTQSIAFRLIIIIGQSSTNIVATHVQHNGNNQQYTT